MKHIFSITQRYWTFDNRHSSPLIEFIPVRATVVGPPYRDENWKLFALGLIATVGLFLFIRNKLKNNRRKH